MMGGMMGGRLRQAKPWERGSAAATLRTNSVGMEKPTRQGWLATGSEFCVVVQEGGTKRKQPVPELWD